MRRWIKASVTAAVVLGLGGYVTEPYAMDWMPAGSACLRVGEGWVRPRGGAAH